MKGNFSSDNASGACAPIMEALVKANAGAVPSYGADAWSAKLHERACELFEKELAIFPVTTGSAANALALSQLAPPYGTIYCHETAHIVTDECGAPEFFTGGAKLTGLPSADGKIRPVQLEKAFAFADEMGVHHVKPGAISITQATEWGTLYSNAEVAQLGALARSRSLRLHMDGARFANALATLNCSPAEATWKSGVDVLSLGATKNGALCAEAVIFFDVPLAQDFDRRRKRAGHLWSKFRFISAQLLAYLEDDLWLRNARHANRAARRLAEGLNGVSRLKLLQPVEANELFLLVPPALLSALESEFKFYTWPLYASSPEGVAIRLVTSYATEDREVDAFIAAVRQWGG